MQVEIPELAQLPVRYTLDPAFTSDRFVKMRLAICHEGVNLNHTSFSVETFEDAAPSLPYSPILAYVVFDEDGEPQFTGHAMHLEQTGDGLRQIYDETPIGVIPENCNYTIEEIDGKQFVCADAYIWKEYSNYALDIVERDTYVPLSMEIAIDDVSYQASAGVYQIHKFHYKGVTFCGDRDMVAMQGAHAVPVEEYTLAGKKFFERLKAALREELSNTDQGGTGLGGKTQFTTDPEINVPEAGENKDPVQEAADTQEESVTEAPEETGEAAQPDGSVSETSEATESGSEGAPEGSGAYQLMSNLMQFADEAVSGVTIDWDGYACRKYFIEDIDTDAKKLYVFSMEDFEVYGVSYSLDGDKMILGDQFVRQVAIYRDYQEGSPVAASGANTYMRDLVRGQKQQMDAYTQQISELQAYKTAEESAKKSAAIGALFEQFGDLKDDKSFEELQKAAHEHPENYEIADLETQCFAIRGRKVTNNYTKPAATAENRIKILSTQNSESPSTGIRALLETFTKKG